jgi:hypothetical protein
MQACRPLIAAPADMHGTDARVIRVMDAGPLAGRTSPVASYFEAL